MIHKGEFVKGTFIERPNRFLALVQMDGRREYAHLPNPGRIKELLIPGVSVILRKENGSKRKTGYTLIMVEKDGILVSLNTNLPNSLAAEAIENGWIREFEGYQIVRREAQYKNSRFDLLLSKDETRCFLEVKSATLVNGRTAMFPDAPTIRGTKHIHHLIDAMNEGYEAGILFVIQRQDADRFTTNDATDPEFASALRLARDHGVKLCAYRCEVGIEEIEVTCQVDIVL